MENGSGIFTKIQHFAACTKIGIREIVFFFQRHPNGFRIFSFIDGVVGKRINHDGEFQPLGFVNGHNLHRLLPFRGNNAELVFMKFPIGKESGNSASESSGFLPRILKKEIEVALQVSIAVRDQTKFAYGIFNSIIKWQTVKMLQIKLNPKTLQKFKKMLSLF